MPRNPSGRPYSPAQRRQDARNGVLESWAHTADRPARTASARTAFLNRFERIADPDGVLSDDERTQRAAALRTAYFRWLGKRSGESRAAKRNADSAEGNGGVA